MLRVGDCRHNLAGAKHHPAIVACIYLEYDWLVEVIEHTNITYTVAHEEQFRHFEFQFVRIELNVLVDATIHESNETSVMVSHCFPISGRFTKH